MQPGGSLVSRCHLLLFPPGRAMLGLYQVLWSKLEMAAGKWAPFSCPQYCQMP